MNECANRGYLVGAKREVPVDPTDFQWGLRLPAVGCNRLRCSVCGVMVRQHAGWLVDRERVRVGAPEYRGQIDELYERESWTGISFVRVDEFYRVYVCRCGFVTEDHELAIGLSTVSGPGTTEIPWSCVGHAEVSLPFSLDGLTFSTVDAVLEAARRAFSGWSPPGLTGEVHGTWVNRLHNRVAGTEIASRIERLTIECLSDSDPSIRVGALRFLPTHRNVDGFRAAANLALDGTPNIEPVQDALVDCVARLYEYDVIDEPRLRDWARERALQPAIRESVIEALAERDPQWLRQSAEAIVRANPRTAGFVLKSVFDAFASEGYTPFDLAAKLARISGISRDQMSADARRWLRGDVRDRVLQILSNDPPPTN